MHWMHCIVHWKAPKQSCVHFAEGVLLLYTFLSQQNLNVNLLTLKNYKNVKEYQRMAVIVTDLADCQRFIADQCWCNSVWQQLLKSTSGHCKMRELWRVPTALQNDRWTFGGQKWLFRWPMVSIVEQCPKDRFKCFTQSEGRVWRGWSSVNKLVVSIIESNWAENRHAWTAEEWRSFLCYSTRTHTTHCDSTMKCTRVQALYSHCRCALLLPVAHQNDLPVGRQLLEHVASLPTVHSFSSISYYLLLCQNYSATSWHADWHW